MLDEERIKKAMTKLMQGDPKMMIVVTIADEHFTVDPKELGVLALLVYAASLARK
jgi:hypothetical protein